MGRYGHRTCIGAVTVVAILFGVVLLGGCGRGVGQAPHIVLLTLDTTRQDRLGCYGYSAARTPVLDGLAAGGVRFDTCVSVVPLTLPAHTTILSGLLPPEHGVRVNGQGALRQSLPALVPYLRERGYRTGAAVAAAVLDRMYGLDRGFEHYEDSLPATKRIDPDMPGGVYHALTPASRSAAEVVDAALAWLSSVGREDPVFLWAHFYDPHDPYEDHSPALGHQFSNPYDSEIAYMDSQIGRLLTGVHRALGRRVVVLAVGDHGESLGEHGEVGHGMTLYRGAMRVPLILSGAGLPKHRVETGAVSLVDIVPTLLDVVGQTPEAYLGSFGEGPEQLAGQSLLGEQRPAHCYMETMMPLTDYGWAPLHGVADGEWKYIRSPIEELYDTVNDPGESVNRAVEFDDVLADGREALVSFEDADYRGTASRVVLSATDRRRLESLGYAAGASLKIVMPAVGEEASVWRELADVKQRLALVALSARVREGLAYQDVTAALLADAWKLRDQSPETPRFHGYVAGCLLRLGRSDEAMVALAAAVARFPEDAYLVAAYGRVLLGQGHDAEAGDMLRRALALAPSSAPTLAAYGVVLLREGDAAEAARHLEASVALDGSSHGAAKYLGDAYAGMGSNDLAIVQYRQALVLNPHWPAALEPLAELLLGRGAAADIAEALPFVWELCEQSGHHNARHLFLLARAYRAAGRGPKAAEMAGEALECAEDAALKAQLRAFLAGPATAL